MKMRINRLAERLCITYPLRAKAQLSDREAKKLRRFVRLASWYLFKESDDLTDAIKKAIAYIDESELDDDMKEAAKGILTSILTMRKPDKESFEILSKYDYGGLAGTFTKTPVGLKLSGHQLLYSENSGNAFQYSEISDEALMCSQNFGRALQHSKNSESALYLSKNSGFALHFSKNSGFALHLSENSGFALLFSKNSGSALHLSENSGFTLLFSKNSEEALEKAKYFGFAWLRTVFRGRVV